MAYYTALITAWNGATQPPTGVTGTALTGGMTTAQKIAAVNAWTIVGPAVPCTLTPTQILNAINYTDLNGLTQLQVSQLTLYMQAQALLADPGSAPRAAIQTIFAGKTTTLNALSALVAEFDSPVISWVTASVAEGGAGLTGPVTLADTAVAGVS